MGEGKRPRRARASAVATAVAIAAPILFLGGAMARAAESSSSTPTSVSITSTDDGSQSEGSATTTSLPPPSVLPIPGSDTSGSASGDTGNTGPTDQSVQQVIAVSIEPGPLTVTPASETISFSTAHGNGNGGALAGSLTAIRVVDARGSLVGWHATVSLDSVTGVSAAELAQAQLCVIPDPPTVVAGNPPEVKAGKRTCGNAGDELTLFYAPPNGGGGTFTDSGSLKLLLPGVAGAGPVTATLAVAVH